MEERRHNNPIKEGMREAAREFSGEPLWRLARRIPPRAEVIYDITRVNSNGNCEGLEASIGERIPQLQAAFDNQNALVAEQTWEAVKSNLRRVSSK